MPSETAAVIECVECGATFTDAEAHAHYEAGGTKCPKCGTTKRPRLVGAAAKCRELANEYLAVKRRGYEKHWPGFRALLESVCEGPE